MYATAQPGAFKRLHSARLLSPHPSHSLLDDALLTHSPRCRARHAVRTGRCADLLSVCEPLWLAVWFWLFAGKGAETEGRARGRAERLFEVIEIAMMEDKMLIKEVLGNTC